MLTHFAVKNFRGFEDWTRFDLRTDKKYVFNESAVRDEVVQHAMIYGENGSGKSNLGWAIVELIRDLSPHVSSLKVFRSNYLNNHCDSDVAEFQHGFRFGEQSVEYHHGRGADNEIVYEQMFIQGKEVLYWDKRRSFKAFIDLPGAETLRRDLSKNVKSLVNYVRNNTAFGEAPQNQAFKAFCLFVNGMLCIPAALMGDGSSFLEKAESTICEDEESVEKLQQFLRRFDLNYELTIQESHNGPVIMAVGKKQNAPLFNIASSGTRELVLLHIWIEAMKDKSEGATFMYFDEFDVFYHHKLAKNIAKELLSTDVQVILTTHNTSIMSNNLLRPDCYFELRNNQVVPLHKLTDREIRKAHNLEKMYRAGAFDE